MSKKRILPCFMLSVCVLGTASCSCLPPSLTVPADAIVPSDTGFAEGQHGRFAVSRDGEATYSYPLWVPPGRLGIEPSIGIQYGSRNSNGTLGVGWNLSIFPRIERCRRTRAVDGVNKAVQFDSTDAFCFSGQRLVVIRGKYGDANAEYRTEEDGFRKIVSGPLDPGGLGPQFWQVFLKNGEILSFGIDAGTSNARVEGKRTRVTPTSFINPSPVLDQSATVRLAWALDRVEDRFGNEMHASYAATNDLAGGVQQLLTNISYTDSKDGTLTAQRSVAFQYEDRPDVQAWNESGVRLFLGKRLSRIAMSAPDPDVPHTVRVYLFQYAIDGPWQARIGPAPSLLKDVTECDGRSTAGKPDGICVEALSTQWAAMWNGNDYLDIDTGIHDSTNAGATTPAEGALFSTLVPADIDGDGCDDLLFATMDKPTGPPPWPYTWKYLLSSCYHGVQSNATTVFSARTPKSVPVSLPSVGQVRAVDIDMDGRTDIVAVGEGAQLQAGGISAFTWPVAIYLAGTDLSSVYTTEIDRQFAVQTIGDPGTKSGGQLAVPQAYIGDINGDGFPDIFTGVPGPQDESGNTTFFWYGSVTHGRYPDSQCTTPPCIGISDPVWVQGPPPTQVPAIGDENIQFTDVDGKGTNELLLRSGEAPGGFPSYYAFGADEQGNQTVRALALAPGEAVTITQSGKQTIPGSLDIFVDVNGDGLPDLVRWPNTGGPLRGPVGNTGSGFLDSTNPAVNETAISATASFLSPVSEPDPGVRVLDFDQDGTEDILFVNCRTTGASSVLALTRIERAGLVPAADPLHPGSFQQPSLIVPSNHLGDPIPCPDEADDGTVLSQVLDVNGDGIPDLIQVVGGELHVYIRRPRRAFAEYIDDHGAQTHIDYSPITDDRVYQIQRPGAQLQQCGPPNCPGTLALLQRYGATKGMWVVSDYDVTHPGIYYAPPNAFRYAYRNGLFDLSAGGWIGFEEVTILDSQDRWNISTDYGIGTSIPTSSDPVTGGTVYPEATRVKQRTERYFLSSQLELDRIQTTSYNDFFNLQPSDPSDHAVIYSTLPSELVQQEVEFPAAGPSTVVRQLDSTFNFTDYGDLHIVSTKTNDGIVDTEYIDRLSDGVQWLTSFVTAISHVSTTPAGTGTTRIEYQPVPNRGVVQQSVVEPGLPDPQKKDQYLQIQYGYDAHGQLQTMDTYDFAQADHRSLRLCHDLLEDQFATRLTNGLGQSVDFAQYPAFGLLVARSDPNGVVDKWQYDGFGRLKRTEPANGAGVSFVYDNNRVLITPDPGDRTTALDLDAYGNVGEKWEIGFGGESLYTSYDYDSQGFLSNVNGPCVYTGAPCPFNDSATHDIAGRLATVSHADGSQRTFSYAELTTTETDESGHVTIATRDELDRTIAVDRVADDGHHVRTSTILGPFGRVWAMSDPAGSATFTYDARGRATDIFDPDAGHTTLQYNAYDQQRHEQNQKNETTDWFYDPLGRPKSIVNKDGTTTFTWDSAVDNSGLLNGIGKIGSTSSPDGVSIAYSYDDAGRPGSASWTIAGSTLSGSATYDNAGRLATLVYPTSGSLTPFSVAYCYNAYGYLSTLADASTTNACENTAASYWTVISANARGDITKEIAGNGVATARQYDDQRGFLQEISVSAPSRGGTFFDAAYSYFPNGDISDRYDPLSGFDDAFSYDALDRLKSWQVLTGPPSQAARPSDFLETYQFDDPGNLRTRTSVNSIGTPVTTVTSYSYGFHAGPHALTGVNAAVYSYDPVGERQTTPTQTFNYSALGLPSAVSVAGGNVSFKYDANKKRAQRISQTGTTTYVGGLYERRQPSAGGSTDVYFLRLGDRIVAQIERDPVSGVKGSRYLHLDAHGSLRAVSDDSGSYVPAEFRRYDPFGASRDAKQPWAVVPIPSSDVTRGFLGQEADADLGLINLNARIYDPTSTRLLTPDPVSGVLEIGDSLNPYAYGYNNPVRWSDPTGLCGENAEQYETIVCGERDRPIQWISFEPTIIIGQRNASMPAGNQVESTTLASGPDARADDSGIRKPATGTDKKVSSVVDDPGQANADPRASCSPCRQPPRPGALFYDIGEEEASTWNQMVHARQMNRNHALHPWGNNGEAQSTFSPIDLYVMEFFAPAGGSGLLGGSVAAESELAIGEELLSAPPLVYGPSAGGKLAELAEKLGGQTLNDLPKPMELGWEAFSKQTLDAAAASGRPVIFDLTNVQDLEGVLSGTGQYADTITGAELRYLHDNWSRFEGNVTFFSGGVPQVGAPW